MLLEVKRRKSNWYPLRKRISNGALNAAAIEIRAAVKKKLKSLRTIEKARKNEPVWWNLPDFEITPPSYINKLARRILREWKYLKPAFKIIEKLSKLARK